MSAQEILSMLQTYGADCLLLALPVCLLTALCKCKCPKRFKKLYTFLPFLWGVALCLAAEAVRNKGFDALPYAELVQRGVRCGSVATIYYVVYEQFLRRKKATGSPLQIALAGVLSTRLPESRAAALAQSILTAVAPLDNEAEARVKIGEILKGDLPDENDRFALAALLFEVVRAL